MFKAYHFWSRSHALRIEVRLTFDPIQVSPALELPQLPGKVLDANILTNMPFKLPYVCACLVVIKFVFHQTRSAVLWLLQWDRRRYFCRLFSCPSTPRVSWVHDHLFHFLPDYLCSRRHCGLRRGLRSGLRAREQSSWRLPPRFRMWAFLPRG